MAKMDLGQFSTIHDDARNLDLFAITIAVHDDDTVTVAVFNPTGNPVDQIRVGNDRLKGTSGEQRHDFDPDTRTPRGSKAKS
jgi:hypothetical protein